MKVAVVTDDIANENPANQRTQWKYNDSRHKVASHLVCQLLYRCLDINTTQHNHHISLTLYSTGTITVTVKLQEEMKLLGWETTILTAGPRLLSSNINNWYKSTQTQSGAHRTYSNEWKTPAKQQQYNQQEFKLSSWCLATKLAMLVGREGKYNSRSMVISFNIRFSKILWIITIYLWQKRVNIP